MAVASVMVPNHSRASYYPQVDGISAEAEEPPGLDDEDRNRTLSCAGQALLRPARV